MSSDNDNDDLESLMDDLEDEIPQGDDKDIDPSMLSGLDLENLKETIIDGKKKKISELGPQEFGADWVGEDDLTEMSLKYVKHYMITRNEHRALRLAGYDGTDISQRLWAMKNKDSGGLVQKAIDQRVALMDKFKEELSIVDEDAQNLDVMSQLISLIEKAQREDKLGIALRGIKLLGQHRGMFGAKKADDVAEEKRKKRYLAFKSTGNLVDDILGVLDNLEEKYMDLNPDPKFQEDTPEK